MFHPQRLRLAAALLAAAAAGPLQAQSASHKEEERKLIGVLQSSAPLFEKAKACQRLAVIATGDAVPALAALLGDEALAHYARFGLEPIPDPAVDEALRAATAKLKGKLLVGAINSIGARRDAKSLPRLIELLGDADAEVRAAAAAAIGCVGDPEAAKALHAALSSAAEPFRAVIAAACLPCAERLIERGRRDEAVKLYDAVRAAPVAEHLRVAALKGAVVARQAAGLELLAGMLRGDDAAAFLLALGLCREIEGREVTRTLIESLETLAPERRALALGALGDRGDREALPAMLKAAKGGDGDVRLAAIRALQRLGDASAVPVLLDAAAGKDSDAAALALETLEALPGRDVDAALAALFQDGEKRLRPTLIEVAGRRRMASAVPALRRAADEEDAAVRFAALRALGNTIGLTEISFLADRLAQPTSAQETAVVQEALKAAAVRMPDAGALSEQLSLSMARAPAASRPLYLDVFIAVGGPKALDAVAAGVKDGDRTMQEAAVRALSEWTSEEAGPRLLALFKSADGPEERLRNLKGLVHLIRRLGFPKERRLALCQETMQACRSDEERKLAIDAFAAVPAVETLAMLTPHLSTPGIQEETCAAILAIAERIARLRADAARDAVEQVAKTTKRKDLAERAQKLLRQ
jgi:HEAT repeat protein